MAVKTLKDTHKSAAELGTPSREHAYFICPFWPEQILPLSVLKTDRAQG